MGLAINQAFPGTHSKDKVKGYLFALASHGYKWSTIKCELASIEHHHGDTLPKDFIKGNLTPFIQTDQNR